MANRIDLSNILINFLKKARYERHIEEGTLEENQFYAVTDGNEKTEYGDLFGNIENQADLYNALYASRLFKMEMCNDVRGYDIVHKLYGEREFDPSKFTVVGSPTISEDGIASGFSARDYLKTGYFLDTSNLSRYAIYLKLNKAFSAKNNFLAQDRTLQNYDSLVFRFDSNDRLQLFASKDGFAWSLFQGIIGTKVFENNKDYFIKFEYDINVGYTISYSEDGINYIKDISSSNKTKIKSFYLILGINNSPGYFFPFNGSIDLKYFSVTVDGEEVFNGLKDLTQYDTYTLPSSQVITIPYIPSVDGVKIVDVAYKPLVDQLYTETGMGNYIIIDETNKTFRLPLPDIYSQIENKTSFTLRKWED